MSIRYTDKTKKENRNQNTSKDYIVNQNDVAMGGKFEDTIAYGGWTMDDHAPTGFKVPEIAPNIFHPAPSPFGLPYRAIYSKNIKNLLKFGKKWCIIK